MIYTLTLNPSLDYLVDVQKIELGETNRSTNESLHFGGKGINVSYVLKQLGHDSVCLGFAAGFTGAELEEMLKREGLECDFIKINNGNTRINVKIKSCGITEINANGPCISDSDIRLLFEKLDKLTSDDTLVLAGSTPKNHDNIYCDIMKKLSDKRVRIVVDTSGRKLLECLKYKPFLVKPNKSELEEVLSVSLDTYDDVICAAHEIKKMGAGNVIVSMGENGAVMVAEDERIYRAEPIKITPISTVGAGDSMIAGFLSGLDRGYEYALQLGNACGAATAASAILAGKHDIYALM